MSLVPAVTATVHQQDADQPLADLRVLEDWLGDSTARARFNMALLATLAGLALVLAVAGIYGVMSHAVFQRTQEMGIRIALGASAMDIFKTVLKDGAKDLLIGAACGFAATLALTRVMKSMLFETSTTDPRVLAAVLAMLGIAGLIACWIPSRRATRVSPVEALRYE
jgi:ABC-type antimicrobial peptide transport system permease subunit